MNKNIYEMLNDIDINLDEYEKEEFNDIEKKKLKKSFRNLIKKKKNYKKGIVTAVLSMLIILGLFGTNIGLEVLAAINTIGSDIATRLGIESNLDDYKTVVNKSITKDGITIQLNEVILDENELIVSSTLKSNEGNITGWGLYSYGEIYINDKLVSLGSGGTSVLIDEYTVEEIMTFGLEERDLSGDLNIKIIYKQIMQYGVGPKNGHWEFEFKTNGDELVADTEEIELNHRFALNNGDEVTIEKYTSNAVSKKIYYKKTAKRNEYYIRLVGTDDLGNKVLFSTKLSSEDGGILTIEGLEETLLSEAESLILTPYAIKQTDESGRMGNYYEKVGEEFTIELNK